MERKEPADRSPAYLVAVYAAMTYHHGGLSDN